MSSGKNSNESDTQTLGYRQNVCMILFNDKNQLLVAERHRQNGVWQFPQGGVEPEYSLEENVIREIEEELSLAATDIKIVKKLNSTHRYEWSDIPQHFVGKFIGQEQTFWLVKVLHPERINVDVEHPEFQKIRWIDCAHILSVVEPVRIAGYTAPINEVSQYFSSL